jgi:hypothetical protein
MSVPYRYYPKLGKRVGAGIRLNWNCVTFPDGSTSAAGGGPLVVRALVAAAMRVGRFT